MKKYSVTLKESVPILTGNSRRKYTEIRPSGLIGSLRWHAEWLFYCLGLSPCNSKSESGIVDNLTQCNDYKKLCPVCELFGCTAKSSSFSLMVEHNTLCDTGGKCKHREPAVIKLKLLSMGMDSDSEDSMVRLNFILRFVQKYAGIGAGISQGYGCFSILDSDLPQLPFWEQSGFMHRNCFFGADIAVKAKDLPRNGDYCSYGSWADSSNIVRKGLRRILDDSLLERHGFFGTFRDSWSAGVYNRKGPKASILKVSNLWKENDSWKMRIWGYADSIQRKQAEKVFKVISDREKLAKIISVKLGIPEPKIDVKPYSSHFGDILKDL